MESAERRKIDMSWNKRRIWKTEKKNMESQTRQRNIEWKDQEGRRKIYQQKTKTEIKKREKDGVFRKQK